MEGQPMSNEDRSTKVYVRCEGCGKIVRPEPGREAPEGWIVLGKSEQFNATRVVCSDECRERAEAR
jgi:hypothetical protein